MDKVKKYLLINEKVSPEDIESILKLVGKYKNAAVSAYAGNRMGTTNELATLNGCKFKIKKAPSGSEIVSYDNGKSFGWFKSDDIVSMDGDGIRSIKFHIKNSEHQSIIAIYP